MAYLTYQGKFLRYNGKMLTTIQEAPAPPDAISLDPTYYRFTTAGGTEGVSVVTCSEAGSPSSFTAEITYDPYGIIQELITTAGNSGDTIWVTVGVNSTSFTECQSASIDVTCGTATEQLTISQDGTVFSCS